MQEKMDLVRAKVATIVEKANQLFGITLPSIQIRFDLRGRTAGQAGSRFGQYMMRFNRDMLCNEAWDHMINNTVPHEIAHIVCFFKPSLGRNHDQGWKRVCRMLGGNGNRCFSDVDVKAPTVYAKGRTFSYIASTGTVHNVSEKLHKNIQMGRTYTLKACKGKLSKACSYEIYNPAKPLVSKPVERSIAPPAAPRMPTPLAPVVGGSSKADRVRSRIYNAKRNNEGQHVVVEWAMAMLDMKRALATAYVSNNWSKVA